MSPRHDQGIMTRGGEAAPFIFIITGEPSGDVIGGALIAALRERTGGRLRIAGIGGESMAEQGLTSLVPLADLAVAGVAEVLPRAPLILRRVRETVRAIEKMRPILGPSGVSKGQARPNWPGVITRCRSFRYSRRRCTWVASQLV